MSEAAAASTPPLEVLHRWRYRRPMGFQDHFEENGSALCFQQQRPLISVPSSQCSWYGMGCAPPAALPGVACGGLASQARNTALDVLFMYQINSTAVNGVA